MPAPFVRAAVGPSYMYAACVAPHRWLHLVQRKGKGGRGCAACCRACCRRSLPHWPHHGTLCRRPALPLPPSLQGDSSVASPLRYSEPHQSRTCLAAPPAGVPYSDVNLRTGEASPPSWGHVSSLSEMCSVSLEFTYLARQAPLELVVWLAVTTVTVDQSRHPAGAGCLPAACCCFAPTVGCRLSAVALPPGSCLP